MSKSYVYLIFDLMLMKKIKQSKAIESNGGCYFRKEGREDLLGKMIFEQGSE